MLTLSLYMGTKHFVKFPVRLSWGFLRVGDLESWMGGECRTDDPLPPNLGSLGTTSDAFV